jgi:peptidoglycan hydrolase-like protein with peptidoglycan-binding domain
MAAHARRPGAPPTPQQRTAAPATDVAAAGGRRARRAGEGAAAGPFAAEWLNEALSEAFDAPLTGIEAHTGEASRNEAIGAVASTEGKRMSFGAEVSAEPESAEELKVVAHETAHALAGGGAGATALDQPGDAGEAKAAAAGERFSGWVRSGMQGPAPHLEPATGGQAEVHREAASPVTRVTGNPMLRTGSQGSQVRALQMLLNAHGSALTVDGDFGPRTEAAVRSFQARQGLVADGIVGPRTASALNTGAGQPAAPTPAPAPAAPAVGQVSGSPVLKVGSKGAAVSALQTALNRHGSALTVDGDFGPRTDAAVRAFQTRKGLVADGLVGPRTAAALNQGVAAPTPAPAPAPAPSPAPAPRRLTGDPMVRQGDRGELVSELQRLLNDHDAGLTVDGVFGSGTASKVRSFQSANGLTADAVVGPRTAAKLYDANARPIPPRATTPDAGVAPAPGSTDVADADPRGVLNDSRLSPAVRNMARETATQMQAEGYRPYIFEGYRSFERQDELYGGGRGVTKVRGGGSWHNYGLAVDIVFYNSRGTGPSWDAPSASWQRLGAVGKAKGATEWGGDWGWDMPHFEFHPNWPGSAYGLADTYRSQGLQAVWARVS